MLGQNAKTAGEMTGFQNESLVKEPRIYVRGAHGVKVQYSKILYSFTTDNLN